MSQEGNQWQSCWSDEETWAEKKTGDKTKLFLVQYPGTLISERVPPQLWHRWHLLVVTSPKKGVRVKACCLKNKKKSFELHKASSLCFSPWSYSWQQFCSTHMLNSFPAFKAQRQIPSKSICFHSPAITVDRCLPACQQTPVCLEF